MRRITEARRSTGPDWDFDALFYDILAMAVGAAIAWTLVMEFFGPKWLG